MTVDEVSFGIDQAALWYVPQSTTFGAMVYDSDHARFPWRSLAGTLFAAACICVPAVVNNAIFALPTVLVRPLLSAR